MTKIYEKMANTIETNQIGMTVFLVFPMPKCRIPPFLSNIKDGFNNFIIIKSKIKSIIDADKALFLMNVFIIIYIYITYINIIYYE